MDGWMWMDGWIPDRNQCLVHVCVLVDAGRVGVVEAEREGSDLLVHHAVPDFRIA